MRKQPFYLLLSLILLMLNAFSQSPAQWRGPERSGIYTEKNLLKEWPASGPVVLWVNTEIGKGYSSAVMEGNTIYVTGMKGKQDYLSALDEQGKLKWQVAYGPSWSQSFPETRGTPTIDEGMVYVVSGNGTIACINANDGKIVWSFDAIGKFNGAFGEWGVCESLLVSGNKVFYTPAGSTTTMVALDKKTGETIWQSESLNDTSAYTSPLLVKYGNKNLVVTVINSYFLGVDADNGKICWKYNYSKLSPEKGIKIWEGAPKTNTITPLYKDGELYITGGYDHVGAKFKLSEDASSVSLIWVDTTLDCHMGGVVLIDGYIYGSNWLNNSKGNWCCIDWATGKTMYETAWFTKGGIVSADGMLYCLEEKTANIALVKPDPQKFGLVSSFKTLSGTGPAWAHPSIYNGKLLIRRGDALMAFDIRSKQ